MVLKSKSSETKFPKAKRSKVYDATITKCKVVDAIWAKTIICIDAEDFVVVGQGKGACGCGSKISNNGEMDDEIIEIDLLVDRSSLKVMEFKRMDKMYLEMDAVIQDMKFLNQKDVEQKPEACPSPKPKFAKTETIFNEMRSRAARYKG